MGVRVGVRVGVLVGVLVGGITPGVIVLVGVPVGVRVGVRVGVPVGVPVGVGVGVKVGVAVKPVTGRKIMAVLVSRIELVGSGVGSGGEVKVDCRSVLVGVAWLPAGAAVNALIPQAPAIPSTAIRGRINQATRLGVLRSMGARYRAGIVPTWLVVYTRHEEYEPVRQNTR